MAGLTRDRNTKLLGGDIRSASVAAGVQIFTGALLMRNAAGFILPATATAGLVGIGRAEANIDNLIGQDGEAVVEYRPGTFQFDTSGDFNSTHIGQLCYAVDDQTVATGDGGGVRSPAGIVDMIDGPGVWVRCDEAITRATAN